MSASMDITTPTRAERLASLWVQGAMGVGSDDRSSRSPWAYRHLHGIAVTHYMVAVFLVGLASVLASNGIYGWAALPFMGAILNFAIGSAEASFTHSVRYHA